MVPNFYDFLAGPVGDKFLNHARWISERYERMNEQLLTLSSTFIGFLAVELALIAQVSEEQIKNLGALKYFGILGIDFSGWHLYFSLKHSHLIISRYLIWKDYKLPLSWMRLS